MDNLSKQKTTGILLKGLYLLLMNVITIPLILLWTITGILLFPLAFIFMKYIMGNSTGRITRTCIWIYGRVWQCILCFFVSFKKTGMEPEKFKTPGIIVVNHRSFFDTYCMNMLPVSNICFAVRAWPFKIFIYSFFMRLAEYLNIETTPWDRTMEITKELLKNGSSILFFPEGHRSRDGDLTRFYSGAFKLALEFNVPIIPVCLTGTETLLPPGRLWLAPSKIIIKVLAPVYPDTFHGDMPHIAFNKHVRNLIKTNLKEMENIDGKS